MKRVRRILALLAYYLFAQYLPDWSFPGGPIYRRVRGALCAQFLASTGERINVESRVFVADGRFLSIGSGSSIGQGSRVYGGVIGDGAMVAPRCTLLKDNHRFDDLEKPIGVQGNTSVELPVVEDWAWVGEQSIILPGRRIGHGAIVGAGSVVTKDVEPLSIVAGNPARLIGHRGGMPTSESAATR